jgi:flagellar protein FliO/FliZ
MSEAAVLRLIVSLVFIVILILAAAWLTRRAGWLRTGAQTPLKVLGSQSLGARAYVALVQVDDARLVVGVTPNHISLLHTLPPAPPPDPSAAAPVEEPSNFASALRKVVQRKAPAQATALRGTTVQQAALQTTAPHNVVNGR